MLASFSLIKGRAAQSDYISYTARVFEEAGWIGRQAVLMTGINSVIYVLSTIPTCVFSCDDFKAFLSDFLFQMVPCRLLGSSSYPAFRRSCGKFLTKSVINLPLIDKFKMAGALMATGWWMYLDIPQTPNAVVFCVIIFNAAFGYRYL